MEGAASEMSPPVGCKTRGTERPVLGRNTILAEVVEKLKKTGIQEATPADHYAGPGDVEWDASTGRKHKAVKSCLDKICSHHDKPLEIYCRTDQQCICLLCVMDEHRGHDTVSAAAGKAEKQKEMGESQREFQQRIQMREKELQELREAVGSFTSSAQSAVEDSERIFTEMIFSIERRRSEVTKLIRDQQKAAVSQAEGDMERLKQEIDELKRRHSELEQFSHTEDHIHFLQRHQALPVTPEAGFGPRISASPRSDFGNLSKVISELKDQLENVCRMKMAEIRHPVSEVHLPQVNSFYSHPVSLFEYQQQKFQYQTWILDFLSERPQSVCMGCNTSNSVIIKFLDDTTVVGLINREDESAYREEVERLSTRCRDNNPSVNVEKAKEIIVDFRRTGPAHTPLSINRTAVETVRRTKFLGVDITE
ncbi:uncharacterized protein [Paramormyrops kingsleyae]|uniref:uncharacterized protein n=1 Tax=Paramormyrops kingsleyae TaxID=1676925 RepID=UPI003B971E5C